MDARCRSSETQARLLCTRNIDISTGSSEQGTGPDVADEVMPSSSPAIIPSTSSGSNCSTSSIALERTPAETALSKLRRARATAATPQTVAIHRVPLDGRSKDSAALGENITSGTSQRISSSVECESPGSRKDYRGAPDSTRLTLVGDTASSSNLPQRIVDASVKAASGSCGAGSNGGSASVSRKTPRSETLGKQKSVERSRRLDHDAIEFADNGANLTAAAYASVYGTEPTTGRKAASTAAITPTSRNTSEQSKPYEPDMDVESPPSRLTTLSTSGRNTPAIPLTDADGARAASPVRRKRRRDEHAVRTPNLGQNRPHTRSRGSVGAIQELPGRRNARKRTKVPEKSESQGGDRA